jgi:predicted SnoaL-like aldol condensation-catalyzing enzyme
MNVNDHEHPRRDDGKIAERWTSCGLCQRSRVQEPISFVYALWSATRTACGADPRLVRAEANNTMATNANNTLEQNKRAALDFFALHVNQRKPEEAAEKYLGRYYIQPDAQAPDGREVFLEISNAAVSQHPQLSQDVKRITADGDLVMAHSLIEFSPEDRGTAVVDTCASRTARSSSTGTSGSPCPRRPRAAIHSSSPDRS